eukprot:8376637-Alexandrium_andersonii.AAC.1
MSASLVGSEMCIRDSIVSIYERNDPDHKMFARRLLALVARTDVSRDELCLLYTSDAADDM